MKPQKVKLGEHDYTVRPQKIGYLIHCLGPNLQEALEAEFDKVDGAELATAKVHGVLAVLIPGLMPVHEFIGYPSAERMEAGDYREEDDPSPEPLQIKAAFKAASDVNGGEVFKHLKALMGPKLWARLTAFVTAKLAEESGPLSTIMAPSPTSPSTSGASDLTSSTTSPPIPTPAASAG